MSNAKVELNYAGFDEYRNSPEVTRLIEDITRKTAERAGLSKTETSHRKTRIVGKVTAKKKDGDKLLAALYGNGGEVGKK